MPPPTYIVDYLQFIGQVRGNYTVRDERGAGVQQVCHTRVVTVDTLTIDCAAPGAIGAKWVAYFPEFGLLRGVVSRLAGPRTVELELQLSDATRRRLAGTIRWMVRRGRGLTKDMRRSPRLTPRYPQVDLTVGNEQWDRALLIDISATGAKLTADRAPSLGSTVMVGSIPATVVRSERQAFGVEFAEPLVLKNFEQMRFGKE